MDFIPNPCYASGVERANLLLPGWKGIPADYFALDNEWIPDHDIPGLLAAADTIRGEMDTANGLGMKLAVGNFSTGQPKLELAEVMRALDPMFAQAARDQHLLNFHVYNPAHFGRWLPVLAKYPTLHAVVGEYGREDGMPRGVAFEQLLETGRRLFDSPQIVGVELYEVRPKNPVNFEVDLPEYQRLAVAV